MLKVLFFIPRPMGIVFGGLEFQVLMTGQELSKKGVEVNYVNYFDKEQFCGTDLVHFFGTEHGFYPLSLLLRGASIPYIVSPIYYSTEHQLVHTARKVLSNTPGSIHWAMRRFLNHAALILPNSNAEKFQLISHWGIDPVKIAIVTNAAFTLTKFVPDPQRFREKFLRGFIASSEPFVLSVGRIDPRKNTLRLIQATTKLGVPLVLIGDRNPTELVYWNRVKDSLATNKHLVRHVSQIASRSQDLEDAYSSAYVHALVSHLETPGLVTLEAGAMGANLVVGECLPVREYFSDMAFFAKPTSTLSISSKITEALNCPRDVFGQSSTIRHLYSWERASDLTLLAYKTVVEKGSTR